MFESSNKKNVGKIAAGFGAAAACLYATNEVQADVVELTFSPASVGYATDSNAVSVNIASIGGAGIGSIGQYNDSVGKSINLIDNLVSFGLVSNGQNLSTSFNLGNNTSVSFSNAADDSLFIGFKTLDGNVGWFSVDFGGFAGSVVYNGNGGQYGTAGETLTVGTVVPAPAGLFALALGATGLQGRRRNRANAS